MAGYVRTMVASLLCPKNVATDEQQLIEDAHQGEGIGGALLARMLELAPQMGFEHAVAHVLAENAGLTWSTRVSEGVVESRAAPVDVSG